MTERATTVYETALAVVKWCVNRWDRVALNASIDDYFETISQWENYEDYPEHFGSAEFRETLRTLIHILDSVKTNADCLTVVREMHPEIVLMMLEIIEDETGNYTKSFADAIEDSDTKEGCDCATCQSYPNDCEGCGATFPIVRPGPDQPDQRTHKSANRICHSGFPRSVHLCDDCYFQHLEETEC